MGEMNKDTRKMSRYVFFAGVGILGVIAIFLFGIGFREDYTIKKQQQELMTQKEEVLSSSVQTLPVQENAPDREDTDKEEMAEGETKEPLSPEVTAMPTPVPVPEMLPEYKVLYEENPDVIGWLSIDGTNIDYPVMQTPGDEQYYLHRDFYGEENRNGCLLMDTDSTVGVGSLEQNYTGGTKPSTNLIVHGHTMKSGLMFGKLNLYEDGNYGKEHRIICFDSLYEKREYELLAVFRSQVYNKSDEVFKYYQFFQADTQEEFEEWYRNIKGRALYDTGVTAQFGDEFITLSCCAYHVEDGRFVVVGKRIK